MRKCSSGVLHTQLLSPPYGWGVLPRKAEEERRRKSISGPTVRSGTGRTPRTRREAPVLRRASRNTRPPGLRFRATLGRKPKLELALV